MDNNEKNLEAIELNEEVLEQASGGSYGNPMNLKGLGTGCVPGGTYVDRNSGRKFYVVKPNDMLYKIADLFNIPHTVIVSLNTHILNINNIWDYDVVWLN